MICFWLIVAGSVVKADFVGRGSPSVNPTIVVESQRAAQARIGE